MWILMFNRGWPENYQLDLIVPILPLEVGAPARDFSWGSGSLLPGRGGSCLLAPKSLGATPLVSQTAAIKSESMLCSFIHSNSVETKKRMPTWWEKGKLNEPLGRGLFYHWLGWQFWRYTEGICEWHEAKGHSEYMAVQLECRWNFTGWNNEQNLLMLNLLWISVLNPGLGSKH